MMSTVYSDFIYIQQDGAQRSADVDRCLHTGPQQKQQQTGHSHLPHSGASLALPDPRRQPVIAYSMNARRERVWDTTVPRFVLAPPELGWAIIG